MSYMTRRTSNDTNGGPDSNRTSNHNNPFSFATNQSGYGMRSNRHSNDHQKQQQQQQQQQQILQHSLVSLPHPSSRSHLNNSSSSATTANLSDLPFPPGLPPSPNNNSSTNKRPSSNQLQPPSSFAHQNSLAPPSSRRLVRDSNISGNVINGSNNSSNNLLNTGGNNNGTGNTVDNTNINSINSNSNNGAEFDDYSNSRRAMFQRQQNLGLSQTVNNHQTDNRDLNDLPSNNDSNEMFRESPPQQQGKSRKRRMTEEPVDQSNSNKTSRGSYTKWNTGQTKAVFDSLVDAVKASDGDVRWSFTTKILQDVTTALMKHNQANNIPDPRSFESLQNAVKHHIRNTKEKYVLYTTLGAEEGVTFSDAGWLVCNDPSVRRRLKHAKYFREPFPVKAQLETLISSRPELADTLIPRNINDEDGDNEDSDEDGPPTRNIRQQQEQSRNDEDDDSEQNNNEQPDQRQRHYRMMQNQQRLQVEQQNDDDQSSSNNSLSQQQPFMPQTGGLTSHLARSILNQANESNFSSQNSTSSTALNDNQINEGNNEASTNSSTSSIRAMAGYGDNITNQNTLRNSLTNGSSLTNLRNVHSSSGSQTNPSVISSSSSNQQRSLNISSLDENPRRNLSHNIQNNNNNGNNNNNSNYNSVSPNMSLFSIGMNNIKDSENGNSNSIYEIDESRPHSRSNKPNSSTSNKQPSHSSSSNNNNSGLLASSMSGAQRSDISNTSTSISGSGNSTLLEKNVSLDICTYFLSKYPFPSKRGILLSSFFNADPKGKDIMENANKHPSKEKFESLEHICFILSTEYWNDLKKTKKLGYKLLGYDWSQLENTGL